VKGRGPPGDGEEDTIFPAVPKRGMSIPGEAPEDLCVCVCDRERERERERERVSVSERDREKQSERASERDICIYTLWHCVRGPCRRARVRISNATFRAKCVSWCQKKNEPQKRRGLGGRRFVW